MSEDVPDRASSVHKWMSAQGHGGVTGLNLHTCTRSQFACLQPHFVLPPCTHTLSHTLYSPILPHTPTPSPAQPVLPHRTHTLSSRSTSCSMLA
eukprot:366345-Chlamydomonas_euryale.AAC.6